MLRTDTSSGTPLRTKADDNDGWGNKVRQIYDIVIVGGGAAGGISAKVLAEAGLNVCVLEAGPLSATDARVDRARTNAARQPRQAQSTSYSVENSQNFIDDIDYPYTHPDDAPFNWFRSRQVGGRLQLWAGVSLRMSSNELVSGTGTGSGWPLSYGDLSPHYSAVEKYMRVTGGREDNESAPNPDSTEAIPFTQGEQLLAQAVRRWPTRQLLSARVAQRPGQDLIADALATQRVTLIPNSVVTGIRMAKSGRRVESVQGVHRLSGKGFSIGARAFVLAASTIETLRLLLASADNAHPGGIGNHSGLLGTHLLDHTAGPSVSGFAPDQPLVEIDRPGMVPVTHIPDFSRAEGRPGFSGSFGITAFVPDRLPMGGEARNWIKDARRNQQSVFRLWASGEVLPLRENRITLGSTTDSSNMPIAHVNFRHTPADEAMAKFQANAMRAIAEEAGFDVTQVNDELLPPGSSVHELGGAPMGQDIDTSVLDSSNRVWGVSNLQVVDGACFPLAGWQNPTLTIMALAHRASQITLRSFRAGNA